ncbi:hypothetical protein ACFQ1L_46300 [Phytohabitans flavus]|uniref:hypothetical protein n=1 Tax=Phytohabitans flavus TaxID=1076124 RepID=UPI003639A677
MADALLFVVHGGTELTASELAFLGQATQRVATVIFVLTQIDKYPAWREILGRNQALIAQHAPRYQAASWFAVSSRAKTDADLALAGGNAEVAARRLEFSGFPALQEAIVEQVARRAAAVRLANAVHVVTMAVDPLLEMYERRMRSLTLDPGLADELATREAAVRDLADRDAVWRKTLASRLKELESVLQLGFRRSVNDLRAIVEEKISTAGPEDFAELAGDLEDGIRGVWMQLENATREGLSRISREIGGELHNAGAVEVANHMALPERLQRMPAPVVGPRDHVGFFAGVERLMPAYGAGSLAFTVLAVATGGIWIPFFVGIGVTAGLMGRRKRLQQLHEDAPTHSATSTGSPTS